MVEMCCTILGVTFSSRSQHDVNNAAIATHGRELSTDCGQIHLTGDLLVVLNSICTTHTNTDGWLVGI